MYAGVSSLLKRAEQCKSLLASKSVTWGGGPGTCGAINVQGMEAFAALRYIHQHKVCG